MLGDLVGYGADPNAVIDGVQELKPSAMVRGNHDKVACGLEQPDGFNAVASAAAQWTSTCSPTTIGLAGIAGAGPDRGRRSRRDLSWVARRRGRSTSSTRPTPLRALKATSRPLCLFGHTHFPVAFQLAGGELQANGPATSGEARLELREDVLYLVNPGSVGQPRDGDPRAAYAIVDVTDRCIELFRVDYPVEKAQAKIIEAGLPASREAARRRPVAANGCRRYWASRVRGPRAPRSSRRRSSAA